MIQQRLQGEGLFPGEEATHEPTDRQGTGEYPTSSRSSGKMEAVFDRSANSAIATAGKEVTGVNKVSRLRPTRKNGALVTGLGVAAFLVLLVLGVALRDYLSRRTGSARSSRPASATAPIVAAPSVLPTPRAPNGLKVQ
jgi:hypothetical protein